MVPATLGIFFPCVCWEDKNPKNPLKRMGGRAPGASLPLWPYKSKLLTPKPKAYHHLLSEGSHPLQGDKHKKHFPCHHQGSHNSCAMSEIQRIPEFCMLVCYNYSFRGNGFLLFIALCLMQNPVGVMV